ncbi:MAG: thermonuclease family protein [Thermus sp.]
MWVELDLQERDRYGRVLAYLYLEDPQGTDLWREGRYRQVNLEMVRAGWAEPYTVPPNVRYAELYLQALQEARGRRRGIWK